MDEGEDVAVFAATPAAIALPARIDVKGWTLIDVKGAQSLVGRAGGAQADPIRKFLAISGAPAAFPGAAPRATHAASRAPTAIPQRMGT